GTVDGDKNLTVAKDGNNIKYGLNRNLDVDSVTAGNTVLDTTGTTVVGKDANGNSTKAVYGASGSNLTGQDSSGNPISANYGLTNSTIKDGAGNSNTTTASSTSVSDPNGNSATTTASGNTVKDSQGNSSSYGATGSSIKDNAGNTTETTASGTNVTDKNGNSNSLTATGNALKDSSGNSTISTASGVTVADALGNSTAVTAEGVKVANGPSLTKTGLDVAGGTITNLKSGEIATGSTDAVTGGQVADVQSQLQKQLGSIGDSAVQYAKNTDGTTNYASIVAGNGKGTTATLGTDSYGNSIVTGGGTTISNVANAVGASDAINKGQLDSAISSNITDVKDGNGNGVSVTGQVVNQNYSGTNPNPDSLFLTYNKAGQTTTDNLTIGETVQKMNKEGVKFAHTNAATEAKDSSAGGENSTALGVNAIAATTAKNSVVIGNDSSVSGQSSIAIGDGAKASGNQSISIGTGNQVTGNNSGAFGDPTVVDGANSYSVGNNNNITQSSNNTFVLGNEVKQTTAGSVVLGTGSGTTNAGNVAGYDAVTNASSTNNQATWKSTTGSVAVGNGTDVTRQITGLAAGSADTDAVNVAQLKSVNGKVNASTSSVANILGGGATVNADGSITNPTYTVNGKTSTTLAGALSDLDSALSEAVQKANTNGKDITVNSVVSGNTTVNNSGVAVADGAGNSSQLAANGLAVTNTTTGNSAQYGADSSIYTAKDGSSTSVSSNGLTIKNKDGSNGASITSSGINAGGQKVTNVANGENATDAVNKGQLDSAVNGVSSSVNQLANSAVQYDTNADGSVNKDKITLGGSNGTTITNVADGAVTAGSKDAVNGGQLANVQNQVTANTNDINSLQNTVSNIGSGKTGIVQQASSDAAVSIGKDSAGTQINVANNAGTSRTISGVANGNVSASSTDAVNGAQVYKVSAATAAALGGGSSVQADGTVSQPTYTVGGTAYNNVGSAVGAIDGKLTGLDGRVGNLENAFNQTSQQMNKLRNDTNAGIAGAMAVGNLPQPTDAGKSMVSAGISGYRGEGAVAVGVSAITDSNKYVWKFGASADTRSNVSGAASVGYQW
ncbi:YadA-like family protein, partial [Acinetobacter sp. B5B]|uniref:YadA-like family protein n=1 Tax=Acinetobacter baretiae TaxID=2605383 RepID=UPI0018C30C58